MKAYTVFFKALDGGWYYLLTAINASDLMHVLRTLRGDDPMLALRWETIRVTN